MLKILYAASENENAKIQLSRFMKAMEGTSNIVKVAAYKRSSPPIHIDWTLDCLKNIFKPDLLSLDDNDNFITYFQQVKYFNPDLIISDLEYFTSHIANVLGTTLWQCSSSIINFALSFEYKYNLGIFKRYAFLFNKNPIHVQRIVNILDNSNCNFVYSHFGDVVDSPPLKAGFEWVRPYHQIGKVSIPCQHNLVAGTLSGNKKIAALLKKYPDSVIFSEVCSEAYNNPIVKDIRNETEYFCNLKNSNLFVCEGQTSFLADAFYNEKYTAVLTKLDDPECVLNSTISEKLGLSKSIYQDTENLNLLLNLPLPINPDKNTKFLHERIEEI